MKQETDHNQSLILVCLARQILKDYPGQTRQLFYDGWATKHSSESLEHLKSLVSLEMRNFRGWCALVGTVASHSQISRYLSENPPRLLSPETIIGVTYQEPQNQNIPDTVADAAQQQNPFATPPALAK